MTREHVLGVVQREGGERAWVGEVGGGCYCRTWQVLVHMQRVLMVCPLIAWMDDAQGYWLTWIWRAEG